MRASVAPAGELLLLLRHVVPQDGVERDVRRVATRGHVAAERLGHRANVVRRSAAADPDVADPEITRGRCEVGHLEPRAGERVDRKSTRLNSSHSQISY